jgi:peroxiredoxin Q/BCP
MIFHQEDPIMKTLPTNQSGMIVAAFFYRCTSLVRQALACVVMGLGLFSVSPAHADIPAVGTMAPEFSLPDQDNKIRQLKDYRGQWVVLYFYPKDDTPGCTQEACQFRDDLHLLAELGAQILGISVDDSASHKKFADKYNLPFPLLADHTTAVARSYGALSDLMVVKYAKRYTFLIDPQGRIAKTYLQVDTSRHSKEIVDDLKKLK